MRFTRSKRPEPVNASDLDQFAVGGADPGYEVEIDGKEDADSDQGDLRDLEDPEPENEQGNPGERWHRLERLQGRIEIFASAARVANNGAQHRGDGGPQKKSQSHALHRDGDIAEQAGPSSTGAKRSATTATGDGMTSGVNTFDAHNACQATSRSAGRTSPRHCICSPDGERVRSSASTRRTPALSPSSINPAERTARGERPQPALRK